jgi:cytochrome c556
MVNGINPAAMAIWDLSNNASSEAGSLDPDLMDSARWAKLEDAARILELHSRRLAAAEILRVGDHEESDGFATKAQVQAMIDADPQGFRDLSQKMANDAGDLLNAAIQRDATRSGDLAHNLSDNCSACHSKYWEKPAA